MRYEETDVTTFDEVWDAALEVEIWCGRDGKAGWVKLGEFFAFSSALHDLREGARC